MCCRAIVGDDLWTASLYPLHLCAGKCPPSETDIIEKKEVQGVTLRSIRYCPDRAARILGRVRELHGGRDYDPTFGKRMTGEGVHARLIARRFEVGCRRYGLTTGGRELRTDLFRLPPRTGDQLSLFC